MKVWFLAALVLPWLLIPRHKAIAHTPFRGFEYADTSGKKVNLNNIKGQKATLIVFWASWCAPCRKEIPSLKVLYSKYKPKGLALVSVSVDEKMAAWKKAVTQENMPWPNLANLPANGPAVMDEFKLDAVPAMVLIDSRFEVIYTGSSFEEMQQKLKELM